MVSWFINSRSQLLYMFNHVFVQKYEREFLIACPGASLRTVRIRRHRSPTRGIIAVISGKNLLDFRRTSSLTFPRLPRARRLDVPGVRQPLIVHDLPPASRRLILQGLEFHPALVVTGRIALSGFQEDESRYHRKARFSRPSRRVTIRHISLS